MNLPNQNSHLMSVCDFLLDRLDDRVRSAQEAGDDHARSFASKNRRLVEQMRRDVEERPWAHREVGNYVLRTARLYREHSEFRFWWG